MDKPKIPVGAVRELPLRYGLPIQKWLYFSDRRNTVPLNCPRALALKLEL
ncbi:hypothetical protein H6G00_13220 [Leptolyngbya sp. FACHB-541]|nr:hypothetical protein [Leptolyngbya sp. FACHB-541]MBD1997575.1 hypothetical protein [Leptolyngbya sp. FACHB-541]